MKPIEETHPSLISLLSIELGYDAIEIEKFTSYIQERTIDKQQLLFKIKDLKMSCVGVPWFERGYFKALNDIENFINEDEEWKHM